MISCQRNNYPLKRNYFQKNEFLSKLNGLLSKEMLFCLWKSFPVNGNDFLSTGRIYCKRKWVPVKGNYIMSQEIASCQRKLFPVKEIICCQRKCITLKLISVNGIDFLKKISNQLFNFALNVSLLIGYYALLSSRQTLRVYGIMINSDCSRQIFLNCHVFSSGD